MQIRRLSSAEADFQKKFSELVAVDASVDPEITRRAEAIVDDVRERGDAALRDFTARFDGVERSDVAGLGDDSAAAFEGFVACSGGRKGDCTGGCRGEEKECLFHGVIGLCRFRMLRV